MAVVPCPRCGEKVADTRAACPRCGESIHHTPRFDLRPVAGEQPAPPARQPTAPDAGRVVLRGVDMSFGDMAALIFFWSLATVPTAIFWVIVVAILSSLLRAAMGG